MTQRRGLVAVALAVVLVLAGCNAPAAGPGNASKPTGGDDVAAPNTDFDDPARDALGWEDGYWYNESVSVDQSDGLTDAELRAYVARAMARVEYIRGKEFTQRVPVSVLSRDDYRNRSGGSGGDGSGDYQRWNDQVWEALFVTGESERSGTAIGDTRSAAVAGFYSPRDDEIKVITDTPASPTIDNATLVHELVHAVQDQHYDLADSKYGGDTQDAQLAVDGLIEGDASYVERRYTQRCGGAWTCVATPDRAGGGSGGGGGDSNLGILLTIFQPYSDGPVYVGERFDAGGWQAIDEEFADPPVSTEQIIHRTDEEPVPIEYRDRAQDGWSTFPEQGEGGSDTLGEASMYVMFWHQARTTGADTIDPRSISDAEGPYDVYNYESEPSAGWGNDRLFPYRKGSGSDAEYGYVWVTEWDSEADAREFRRAYRAILDAQDAEQRAESVYVVPDGEFADAFRIRQSGTRVTIVNGPTAADLDDIRPRR